MRNKKYPKVGTHVGHAIETDIRHCWGGKNAAGDDQKGHFWITDQFYLDGDRQAIMLYWCDLCPGFVTSMQPIAGFMRKLPESVQSDVKERVEAEGGRI